MRIDLQSCRHSEMKYFCKWFSDGNCKLSIENCKAPCEKYIDEVVEQLDREKEIHTEYYAKSLYKDYPEIEARYEINIGILDKAIEIVKAGSKE